MVTTSLFEVADLIKNGQVGVIPTDTIYGVVGSALDHAVVERIYNLRKRNKEKPMIVLISSLDDLEKFGVKISEPQKEFLQKIWPNPVSIVLPVMGEKFTYLHRGRKSLAFRMPKKKYLLEMLKISGPVVAPSANFEGEKFAENITDAKKHFGANVNFYVDAGDLIGNASTVIELTENGFNVLRVGSFKLINRWV